MNFGEKLKKLRKGKKVTQAELGKAIGVSARTIAGYESCGTYPRTMQIYEKLAAALDTTVNYLRTEGEDVEEPKAEMETEDTTEIVKKYGTRGQRQMEALKKQISALFAGGDLDESEQVAFLLDLNEIFIDAKVEAQKYTPKKYQKPE